MNHEGCIHCEVEWGCVYCNLTTLVYIRADRLRIGTGKGSKKDFIDMFGIMVRRLVPMMRDIPVGGFVLMSKRHDTPKVSSGFGHIVDLYRWWDGQKLKENRQ